MKSKIKNPDGAFRCLHCNKKSYGFQLMKYEIKDSQGRYVNDKLLFFKSAKDRNNYIKESWDLNNKNWNPLERIK